MFGNSLSQRAERKMVRMHGTWRAIFGSKLLIYPRYELSAKALKIEIHLRTLPPHLFGLGGDVNTAGGGGMLSSAYV